MQLVLSRKLHILCDIKVSYISRSRSTPPHLIKGSLHVAPGVAACDNSTPAVHVQALFKSHFALKNLGIICSFLARSHLRLQAKTPGEWGELVVNVILCRRKRRKGGIL